MTSPITISELWHYPIKSCRGWRMTEAQLGVQGIRGDRQCMIVSDAEHNRGRFLTQREFPQMALIEPRLEFLEMQSDAYFGTHFRLTLNAPTMTELRLESSTEAAEQANEQTTEQAPEQAPEQATIWDDTVTVVSLGTDAATWLSDYLRTPCKLVRMHPQCVRTSDQTYAARPTDNTLFADGFSVLLASEDSLADLNTRLVTPAAEPVPMTRFRPNIVISGAASWAEDRWKRLRIGSGERSLTFDVVKPCGRCIITTIDQHTAVKTTEPLPTLKKFRRNAEGTKVLFGQNLTLASTGVMRLGDTVEVIETM
jgi:uncharacterized protein